MYGLEDFLSFFSLNDYLKRGPRPKYFRGSVQDLGEGPWLVWLSGLRASMQTKGSLVRFPVRAHAWVAGQVPSRGRARVNHTLMFPPLAFTLPSPPSKNK